MRMLACWVRFQIAVNLSMAEKWKGSITAIVPGNWAGSQLTLTQPVPVTKKLITVEKGEPRICLGICLALGRNDESGGSSHLHFFALHEEPEVQSRLMDPRFEASLPPMQEDLGTYLLISRIVVVGGNGEAFHYCNSCPPWRPFHFNAITRAY